MLIKKWKRIIILLLAFIVLAQSNLSPKFICLAEEEDSLLLKMEEQKDKDNFVSFDVLFIHYTFYGGQGVISPGKFLGTSIVKKNSFDFSCGALNHSPPNILT